MLCRISRGVEKAEGGRINLDSLVSEEVLVGLILRGTLTAGETERELLERGKREGTFQL